MSIHPPQPRRCGLDHSESDGGLQNQRAQWARSEYYNGVCRPGFGFLGVSNDSRDVCGVHRAGFEAIVDEWQSLLGVPWEDAYGKVHDFKYADG